MLVFINGPGAVMLLTAAAGSVGVGLLLRALGCDPELIVLVTSGLAGLALLVVPASLVLEGLAGFAYPLVYEYVVPRARFRRPVPRVGTEGPIEPS